MTAAGVALLLALSATQAGAAQMPALEYGAIASFVSPMAQPDDLRVAQLGLIQATPYRWSVEKSDGGTIVLNGYVPDAAIQARLLAAAGPRALDASSIAGGEPEEFSDKALTALTILLALDSGSAAYEGGDWQISGTTGTAVASDYVERLIGDAGLAEAGWRIDIDMAQPEVAESSDTVSSAEDLASSEDMTSTPVVEDAGEDAVEPEVAEVTAQPFGFAVRTLGESWLVGGNAPSAGFQRYIELHFGVRTRGELVVADAPDGFASSALSGMEALKALDSGVLAYGPDGWSLTGFAADADLEKTLTASLESTGIEADIAVAEAEAVPELPDEDPEPAESTGDEPTPAAAPSFGFAVRTLGEDWLVGGNAPSAAFQRYVELHFGKTIRGELAVTEAPEGFTASALAGMEALATLQSGHLRFDGTAWYLAGLARDEAEAQAAEEALQTAGITAEIGIAELAPPVETAEPAPAPVIPPLPLPTANPYRWVAEQDGEGTLSISGYVPAESVARFLGVRIGDTGKLDVALASGAPEGFAGDVIAGLDALAALESGTLSLGADGWSLSGKAADETASDSAFAALGARAEAWATDIAVPPPPPPPVDKGAADYLFSAFKPVDGPIFLAGDVPAEATRAFLGMLAGEGSADGLMVRDGAPQKFLAGAIAAVRALGSLDSGRFDYRNFAWSFSGESDYAATREAARASLAALSGPPAWTIDITGPTPLELCIARVSAFDERNAILFDAGSARITRDSLPALVEIADVLKACPAATVQVEGHTDADGDEESNLILSVARAEAVVDRLIELGIGEARLYAIGYGESLPVASNETRDGKQRNRRIVLSVSEDQ